jgi:hypothetical protein
VWIGVRLSLIAVETFAEGRFHLTAYWPLAKRKFWYLLASYGFLFLAVFLLALLGQVAVLLIGESPDRVIEHLIGAPSGADAFRRLALLGLAGALIVVPAIPFAIFWTMVWACQAHAYRAITTRPWG